MNTFNASKVLKVTYLHAAYVTHTLRIRIRIRINGTSPLTTTYVPTLRVQSDPYCERSNSPFSRTLPPTRLPEVCVPDKPVQTGSVLDGRTFKKMVSKKIKTVLIDALS